MDDNTKGLTRLQSRCQKASFSSGGLTREESVSNLTQVGRIYFFVVVELRAQLLVGCQVKGPELLEAACSSYRLSTGFFQHDHSLHQAGS